MKGNLRTNEAIGRLAETIHRADPSACFSFELWDGDVLKFGAEPKVTMRINSPQVVRKMFSKGFLGFGEAYTAGSLDVEGDLQELLRLGLIAGFDESTDTLTKRLRLLPFYLKSLDTPGRAQKNIAHHYDLTNEFFSLMLDPSLTYSCAYFRTEADSLEQAQQNKYEHVARKLMLSAGDNIIDIGCGWGGMLLHSAQRFGISGKGVTLSQNQYSHAKNRIENLGLANRIEVKLLDYRKVTGKFEKFVSIGMFEHVGKEFIAIFMKKIAGLLKKGGIGLLHTISKDTESHTDAWIQRYIFPGGYIPSLSETVREMGRAGLCILDTENLRMHYARTLDCWIVNFESNIDLIEKMFDKRFIRMWRLYLNASSATFKYDGTRLYQILFSNGLNNDLPMVRDYMYC